MATASEDANPLHVMPKEGGPRIANHELPLSVLTKNVSLRRRRCGEEAVGAHCGPAIGTTGGGPQRHQTNTLSLLEQAASVLPTSSKCCAS